MLEPLQRPFVCLSNFAESYVSDFDLDLFRLAADIDKRDF